MSLARKPYFEPEEHSPAGSHPTAIGPEVLMADDPAGPARGVALGLLLSLGGFWLPVAAFAWFWLAR